MVEGNAVQVAAAIVEITDTLPVWTDGFGTVAQCVVAVMPDVASGCAVQSVVAVFPDKVARSIGGGYSCVLCKRPSENPI